MNNNSFSYIMQNHAQAQASQTQTQSQTQSHPQVGQRFQTQPTTTTSSLPPNPFSSASTSSPYSLQHIDYSAYYNQNPHLYYQYPPQTTHLPPHYTNTSNLPPNSSLNMYYASPPPHPSSSNSFYYQNLSYPYPVYPAPSIPQQASHLPQTNYQKSNYHNKNKNNQQNASSTSTTTTSSTISTTTTPSIELSCEPCEKTFNSTAAYQAHMASHEPCCFPSCTFIASKKVLNAHFHSAHGTYSGSGYKEIEVEGRKFNVLLGTNEKEIEKWREERKRKFPTQERILNKKLMEEEVLKSGGIVEDSSSNSNLKKMKTSDESINPANICRSFLKGTCRRGKKCRYLHIKGDSSSSSSSTNVKKNKEEDDEDKPKKKNGLIIPKPYSGGARGTLLKKLIEDQVAQESHLLLQAIRFIRKEMI